MWEKKWQQKACISAGGQGSAEAGSDGDIGQVPFFGLAQAGSLLGS